MKDRLEAVQADITTLAVDAIVNAANAQLVPGAGVDGAIRQAGGAQLNAELARIGYCAPGSAVLTPGYSLPARFVIHTVAPIWRGGDAEEERLLASCYTTALNLADQNGIVSIAFPAIGTGAYGWPARRASELAFDAVAKHFARGGRQHVIFCCFSAEDRERYAELISALP
ncbi:MAG: macro domain-containing protein [Alphaproteobacteria bacterium]|nr:macro domain-containing protein [Alphaproteobacteria bacterium]